MPYLIRWFTYAEQLPLWWVFVYIVAIFGSQATNSLFQYHAHLKSYDLGLRIRASLTTLVYRKTLGTSVSRSQTSGTIVNLLSTDAQIMLESLSWFVEGAFGPILIIVIIGLLSMHIGAFCFIPLAVAFVTSPFAGIFAGQMGAQIAVVLKTADERLKLVKELLNAIRIVKYYAWELPFLRNIDQVRLKQISQVRSYLFTYAWMGASVNSIPVLSLGLTFFFYGLKYELTNENIFSAMVYLNMLSLPFIFLPMMIGFGSQYVASIYRIQFFALRSEMTPRTIDIATNEDDANRAELTSLQSSSRRKRHSLSLSSSIRDQSDLSSDLVPLEIESNGSQSRGGMYIKGASFSWETLLSIAEGQYIDLEDKEASLSSQIEAESDGKAQKVLKADLAKAQFEKTHLANIIQSINLQKRNGIPVHEVNIDHEEINCIDAPEVGTETSATEADFVAAPGNGAKIKGDKKDYQKHQITRLRRPVVNLKDINFDIKEGSLTMVVGSVGSGKSTLAMAFLGEVHQIGGTVRVFSEYAFSSQEAWILNATIRDNITFGSEFDAERYEEVIRCCALTADLATFPASDLTEIGERGINLSGGQRQRINVARAMYSRAPIVILDDPFSAVDSHVGEHMFEHVAMGLRKAGRTVLLITNQLHFVPHADYIGVVKNGRIVEQGTFASLTDESRENGVLSKMLAKLRARESEKEEAIESMGEEVLGDLKLSSSIKVSRSDIQKSAELEVIGTDAFEIRDLKDESIPTAEFRVTPEQDEENRRKGALILLEEREEGNINLGTYWTYLKSGSLWIFLLYLFFQLATSAVSVFNGIWLSWWSSPVNSRGYSKGHYLGGYISLVISQVIGTTIAQLVFVFFCVNTGKALHSRLLHSVARSPISWFDRTPIGRLIARFSKDIYAIDLDLPMAFDNSVKAAVSLLGLFASIATGTPYILIIIAVALFSFGALLLHYRKTSIQVQRIDALSRAPIFSHFAETLEGVITIRAYRMENAFKVANMNKVNDNNIDFMALRYCSAWFAMTLDMMGNITVLLSYIAMVLVRYYSPSSVNIGLIIFAISQTGPVTQTLAYGSTMVTDLENKMNAVERVLQYSKLESEGPFETDKKPDAHWPSRGEIKLKDLSVEYKPGLPVLKHLNCIIKPHEKVGIVGRTGAGKSTFITALFRTMEPSTGSITIDDVDITSIGLTDLRSKLSIIPQTPQLFVGTVRYNLDPFGEHDDQELWRVLKMVKLKKHIGSLDGGLSSAVEENGTNFSVGQRQLLAMARCLLRETHVLLLDEATAAVDVETDVLLQKMIRKNFADKTVLTIAHRLNTIMDSDRIMVLDNGNIVEFDTPWKLLSNRNGVLYGMVAATGDESAQYLHEIARQKQDMVRGGTVEKAKSHSKKSSKQK